MTDVFVYYQVPSTGAAQLLPRVMQLQAELARRYGVQVALKRRPEEKQGMQTWMEIYFNIPDAFLTALQEAVYVAELPIHGERHIEIFVDLPECA